MIIDGEMVFEGMIVGILYYIIYYNVNYYFELFVYKLERWIVFLGSEKEVGVREQEVVLVQSVFCLFLIGLRGCIGKGLVYVEMSIIFVRVLYMYDFCWVVGVEDLGEGKFGVEMGREKLSEFQLVDIFISLKNGCMVEFRRRDL